MIGYLLKNRELLPSHLFAYYSGRNERIETLFQEHQRRFNRRQEIVVTEKLSGEALASLYRNSDFDVEAAEKLRRDSEPWNGEFYVSFGNRSWEDACHYGFISGGGGAWYSQTLKLLQPDDRVWVKIPGTGYVGVGRVLEPVQPVSAFMVSTPEGEKLAMDVLQHGDYYRKNADDPDLAEYFVRVKWLDVREPRSAINEVGLFGNQNTVCKPTTPKWRHTVERLKTKLLNWDAQ